MSANKNPLEDGTPRSDTDTMYNMLAFGLGLREGSRDPLEQVALLGLKNVATSYASGDLTEKARSIRTIHDMTPIVDSSKKEQTFETTTYSPEEIRGGLVRVLTGLSGEAIDHFRNSWGIPAPAEDNKEVTAQSAFKPEEETVALGLIGLGLGISKQAEEQDKVLRPTIIWTGEPIELLTQTLGKEGYIKGSGEEQTAFVESVKSKLLTELQGAIKANDIINQHHRHELSRQ